MPAKIVYVTGISGCEKDNYLSACCDYHVSRGKRAIIYPIGRMIFEIAEEEHINLTPENVLNSNEDVTSLLASIVFRDIVIDFAKKNILEKNDIVFFKAHECFYWNKVFLSAHRQTYFKKFPELMPDFFVTFIDASNDIQKRLKEIEQWQDQKLSEAEILSWLNEEVRCTKKLSYLYRRPFYVIAAKQPVETLYYLAFEPEREKIYVNMPISHLKPQEFEKVKKFIEKLGQYFTVFNPLTIETGKVDANNPDEDLAVHYHTVHRDLNWLLDQCAKSIAYFPRVVPSPGVDQEIQRAHETNKDVWVIFPTNCSPFLRSSAKKMFHKEEDFFEFLGKVYMPARIKKMTVENTIKRKCPDGSVGVIFKNNEGKILMLERKTEPLGWASVAGHLDGQNPEKQAVAESLEEVGLKAKKLNLLLGPVEIMNPCRRPKDSQIKYNYHDWWVFEAVEWEGPADGGTGEPKSGEPDKIGEVKWFDVSEIVGLNLDPAWKILFPMLKISE